MIPSPQVEELSCVLDKKGPVVLHQNRPPCRRGVFCPGSTQQETNAAPDFRIICMFSNCADVATARARIVVWHCNLELMAGQLLIGDTSRLNDFRS